MCQIVIISHNSAQFEKLNICIVSYITNYQNFRISKFTLHHLEISPLTKFEMFFLKHNFLGKSKMLFSYEWDLNEFSYPVFILNLILFSILFTCSVIERLSVFSPCFF